MFAKVLSIVACGFAVFSASCATDPRGVIRGSGDSDEPVLEIAPSVFTDDEDPALAALPTVPNELLVQIFPGADPDGLAALYDRVGVQVDQTIPEIDLTVLRVEPEELESAAQQLASSGLLENLQRNYVYGASLVPDDPQYGLQAHLPQIDAPQAWEQTIGSEDMLIALVDTGVQPDHPDLADRIVGGWNVYDHNSDFGDGMGHGTAVAGVIAAVADNDLGVTGVTWSNPVLAIRAADEEGTSTSRHLAAGILYAVGQGARLINISFAPLQSNSIVKSAAVNAANRGSLVIMSAGNTGQTYPAIGYDQSLFVGAITATDRLASFSDKGPFVDLVAPGSAIRSTALNGGYRLNSGTSFSAPIVTGVAALAWSVNPNLSPSLIRDILASTAKDLGIRGEDDSYGHGAVQAAVAVKAATEAVAQVDVTPPTVGVIRPMDGSSKDRRFIVSASAADDAGVAEVLLSIDGIPFATDTQAPYHFVVDPGLFSRGSHELALEAVDTSGNRSHPGTLTVEFAASPSTTFGTATVISFLSPEDGSTVSGNRSIRASIEDTNGLATVEWFVDGKSAVVNAVGGASAIVTFFWRSDEAASGSHTITLIVTDAFGSVTQSELTLIIE
ncbi:MAG: S8 family serine peptidase [Phycisphaerales bacterium]|nr:MAG: S8 family serine peptidase [Phycisphaerales bacterium]